MARERDASLDFRSRSAVFQAAEVGFDSRTGYWLVIEIQVGIASGNALGFQNRRLVLRGSIPPPPARLLNGPEAQLVERPVVNGKDAGSTPVWTAARTGTSEGDGSVSDVGEEPAS